MISHNLHAGRGSPRVLEHDGGSLERGNRLANGAWPTEPFIAEGILQAVDRLEQGIVLVAQDTRILFASAAAREFLSAERGLRVSEGCLSARAPAESAALRGLIARATCDSGRDPPPLFSMQVGEPPLLVLVTTAAPMTAAGLRGAAGLLFILDPRRSSLPSLNVVRQYFGLTTMEAAVAVEIIRGKGVAACARRLGVSVETARTHLRRIFGKTGVRRQAELVHLLLSARHSVREAGGSGPSGTPKPPANERDEVPPER